MRVISVFCKLRRWTLCAVMLGVIGAGCWHWQVSANRHAATATRTIANQEVARDVARSYGQLPVRFEANQGQHDARVKFAARGNGYTFFLTPEEMVWRLRGNAAREDVLRMRLHGATTQPPVNGLEPLATRSHYLRGNDPSGWQTDVPSYGRVRYAQVYPGVDLIFYGTERQLEYDFVVAPGADTRQIQLAFSGARQINIARNGDLVLRLATGELRQRRPVLYQMVNGQRRTVRGGYRLHRNGRVGFRLGAYDRTQPLWIDPVLVYSTLLGGAGLDYANAIAVDASGAAYLTGRTDSSDLPASNGFQTAKKNLDEAFVVKLNPAGTAVVYATYLGGDGVDVGRTIDVDASGQAVIGGTTGSANFPVRNALQAQRKGPEDGFLAKLNATGTELVWATYLGGVGFDGVNKLKLDAQGNVVAVGQTAGDFPTVNAAQSNKRGSLVFASVNSGANWQPQSNGLTGAVVRELAVDARNPATLYAATENQLYKTTDRGATWRPWAAQAQGLITALAIDPTNGQTLYVGTTEGFFKTTDGGATLANITNRLGNVMIFTIAVDPLTPSNVYLGSVGALFKSTDGGANFTPLPLPLTSQRVGTVAIDPQASMTVYAGTGRGVLKTTNGGASWTINNNGLTNIPMGVSRLALDPRNPQTLYAFAQGALYQTVNGAGLWERLNAQNFSGTGIILIDPLVSTTLYVASGAQGLLKSTDGGTSFSPVNNGLEGLPITALALDPQNTNNLYAGFTTGNDGFVAKLNAPGTALLFSTYLGGSAEDTINSLALDGAGNVYVTGSTDSRDFPLTTGSVRPLQNTFGGVSDAFVSKLSATGNALLYSTYLGGSQSDFGNDIAVTASGQAVVTGATSSLNFPTLNPLRMPTQTQELPDAFVTRLKADGSGVDYSTYLGGGSVDSAQAVVVDAAGNVTLAGFTSSSDFPALNPVQEKQRQPLNNESDAFVTRLNASGTAFTFSSYLGGLNQDFGLALAQDAQGGLYLSGYTASSDFPLLNPLRNQLQGLDGFIVKIGAQAELALTQSVAPNPVMQQNRLTYTLTVTNHGPDEAVGVTLTDPLPSGLSEVLATTTQGTCSGTTTITCNLGALAPRASVTVTIKATATTLATLRNTAELRSTTPDKDLTNNTATVSSGVSALPSLYGRVTLANSAPVSGVSVQLSDPAPLTITTDALGRYQFPSLPGGTNARVTPSAPGYVFRPPSYSYTNLRNDQEGNFTATFCEYTLAPRSQTFQKAGGIGSLIVTTNDALCPWTARSNDAWLTITAGATGIGNGKVDFRVTPTTSGRRGSLTVAGRTFTVFQEADACGALSFLTARQTEIALPITGEVSLRPLSGDLNGDGRSDLVWLSSRPIALITALGNGAGGFLPAMTSLLTGLEPQFFSAPSRLALGDLNRDGKSDLVMLAQSGNTTQIAMALGKGDGTFAEPRLVGMPGTATVLTLADFNKDGRLDLATVSPAAGTVTVLLGQADGTFGAGTSFGIANLLFQPDAIAVGDFNGDGNLDCLISENSRRVILQGDGTGLLTVLPGTALTQSAVNSGVVADFNQDGRADIVSGSLPSRIEIQLSRADGTQENPRLIAILGSASQFSAGDFNADGKMDVLVLNNASQNLALLGGLGDGNFAAPLYYSVGTSSLNMSVGEFTGDNRPDVVVYTYQSPRTEPRRVRLTVLANAPGGLMAAREWVLPRQPRGAVAGDFNNDGKADNVFSYFEAPGNGLIFAPGLGDGTFGEASLVPTQAALRLIEARDFNRDGRLDVIASTDNALVIYFGNGRGGFPLSATAPVGRNNTSVAFGDFNQDGHLDVVGLNANNVPQLLLSDGTGDFAAPVPFGTSQQVQQFAVGDFNGDSYPDVAAAIGNVQNCGPGRGLFWLYLGNGRGALSAAQPITADSSLVALRAEDLNGDGLSDLIATTSCATARLTVLLSQGQGSFQAPIHYPMPLNNYDIGNLQFTDLNGDGKPDGLMQGIDPFNQSPQLFAFLNQGGGSLSAPFTLLIGTAHAWSAADFNGDGKTDVTAAYGVSQGLVNNGIQTVLLNNCAASGQLANASAASYFNQTLAPETIVAAFGATLANATQVSNTRPLPVTLAGTTVRVRDSAGIEHLAPLFFVSPNQVNYLLPAATARGLANVTITNANGVSAAATINVTGFAPGLFAANANGREVAAALYLRIRNGVATYEPVAEFNPMLNRYVARPFDLGPTTDQVFLVLFGTGIRGRNPANQMAVFFGNSTNAIADYAGAQGELVGLDQINVRLTNTLAGRGEIEVSVGQDQQFSNIVRINIR